MLIVYGVDMHVLVGLFCHYVLGFQCNKVNHSV